MTGDSTPARPSALANRGTDSSDSTACPTRAEISALGTPWASSSPARRLRDWGASAVATRSPVPARPIIDSGWAPRPSAKRQTSPKMCPAAAPAAFRPWLSVAPAASAAAFLAAPASSTPDRVAGLLADHAGAREEGGERLGQRLVLGGGDERGALGDHLLGVGGAAEHGDAVAAVALAQQRRGRDPVRRDEPLGQRDDRGAGLQAGRPRLAITSLRPRDGTPRKTYSERCSPAEDGLDAQLARQLHAGEVGLVDP